jgi:hypothetical protein
MAMKITMLQAALAAALLVAGAAAAQDDGSGRAKIREACAADLQKLCPDKTGPDRRQCMSDNRDRLSDGCKAAIMERMKARAADGQAPPQH